MNAALTKNMSTLRETITYLNSNGVTGLVNTPKERAYKYNCWGFTRGLLEDAEDFEWVEMSGMEDWLKANTRKVTRPKCGDIVVFRGIDEDGCCCNMYDEEGEDFEVCTCPPELLHTAILVDPVKMIIIHKPGGRKLERCTVDDCLRRHHVYGEVTEFRRKTK